MVLKVIDSFEIRAGMVGMEHMPGVVVALDGSIAPATPPKAGDHVRLKRPGGVGIEVVIGEVKAMGQGLTFYFEGLKKADAPVGTEIELLAKPSTDATSAKSKSRR